MRLLNTHSLQFQEFFDEQRPKYAILSHRWGSDEVSYKEFSKGRKQDAEGHRKVLAFCELAKARDHEWVWVDTCVHIRSVVLDSGHALTERTGCIDKRSSAELSEAINSMFRWYRDAETCYAYLADVPSTGDLVASLWHSDWFKRGWTLQELLAPRQVVFCNAHWDSFGDRSSKAAVLSEITKIEEQYLDSSCNPVSACVAVKMSWMSRRKTTRREDLAYCMLGLFSVNMPLLYGEGDKAFLRLQMELIRKSNDQTIFAWESSVKSDHMLAMSPQRFTHHYSSSVIPRGMRNPLADNGFTYHATQRGLELCIQPRMWIYKPRGGVILMSDEFCEFKLHHEDHYPAAEKIPCMVLRPFPGSVGNLVIWYRNHVRLRPVKEAQRFSHKVKASATAITLLVRQPNP